MCSVICLIESAMFCCALIICWFICDVVLLLHLTCEVEGFSESLNAVSIVFSNIDGGGTSIKDSSENKDFFPLDTALSMRPRPEVF